MTAVGTPACPKVPLPHPELGAHRPPGVWEARGWGSSPVTLGCVRAQQAERQALGEPLDHLPAQSHPCQGRGLGEPGGGPRPGSGGAGMPTTLQLHLSAGKGRRPGRAAGGTHGTRPCQPGRCSIARQVVGRGGTLGDGPWEWAVVRGGRGQSGRAGQRSSDGVRCREHHPAGSILHGCAQPRASERRGPGGPVDGGQGRGCACVWGECGLVEAG